VRTEFRRRAVEAGVRRRFAPHQLRHAHAVELAGEGVSLNVIQRQLGHANLGITSIWLQGIDIEEIISTVHARRAPMMSATAGLQLRKNLDAQSASADPLLALRVLTAECSFALRKRSSEDSDAALPQALGGRPEQRRDHGRSRPPLAWAKQDPNRRGAVVSTQGRARPRRHIRRWARGGPGGRPSRRAALVRVYPAGQG
jgi:Phage integrase family